MQIRKNIRVGPLVGLATAEIIIIIIIIIIIMIIINGIMSITIQIAQN